MIYWKIIMLISILGIGTTMYLLGWMEWIKDWRKILQNAKYYAIACGIGVNLYWIYLILTNA